LGVESWLKAVEKMMRETLKILLKKTIVEIKKKEGVYKII
jgi:hypothetical protein